MITIILRNFPMPVYAPISLRQAKEENQEMGKTGKHPFSEKKARRPIYL